jgi:hypothetical protein
VDHREHVVPLIVHAVTVARTIWVAIREIELYETRSAARDSIREGIELEGPFCTMLVTILNSVLDSFRLCQMLGTFLQRLHAGARA